MRLLAVCSLILLVASGEGAQQPAQEAISLLGKPLIPVAPSGEARRQLEANLASAKTAFDRNPSDAEGAIWLGRRLAYLGRYRSALEVFSKGIAQHPDDARFYRHRGHRYITVRELDRAVADLAKAADLIAGRPDEIEPDGQPNARNIPTSTLQTNIYYHLGLAHYLKGDFESALAAYRRCLEVSKNPDMLVATTHWLYMTLRRLDRRGDAHQSLEPISADMGIIENGSYHRLLMLYKGQTTADTLLTESAASSLESVTIGYGVGNWHLYNGRRDQAMAMFRKVVDSHAAQWPAFGYVAAEAELARGREGETGR